MSETKTRKEYALEVGDHIAYEMYTFLFCVADLIRYAHNNIYHNVLVESLALHFRNLCSFFTHKAKKPRIDEPEDENVYYHDIKQRKYNLNSDLLEEYTKVCKGIAHIDRSRTELKKDGWGHCKLYNVLKTPILDFINDPEILPHITEIDLIPEIKNYCDLIDRFLNNLESKGLIINKVDTTSGSKSITTSIIQG